MFFLLSILFLGCSTNTVIAPAGTYTADDGSWIIITKSNTWYGKIYETSIASSIDWEYFYAGEISANNELVITHGETRRVLPGDKLSIAVVFLVNLSTMKYNQEVWFLSKALIIIMKLAFIPIIAMDSMMDSSYIRKMA